VRRSGATYEAVVTPRWGTPRSYTATASDTELKMTGTVSVSGGGATFAAVTDNWKELRLGVAGGALSGSVEGSGDETIIMGDVIDSVMVTTKGTIAPDATLPELRSEVGSPILPQGQMLPWETIRIRAAEPIATDAFATGLSVRRADPDPNPPMPSSHWVTHPTDDSAWAGAVVAAGKVGSWDEINGIAMQVRATGAAVYDRMGHNMREAFSAPFTFIDLNLATTGFPLEAGPTPIPAKWGEVTVHGMMGADAMCESGSCLVLGPFDNGWCNVGRRGVAARLNAPRMPDGTFSTHAKLRVRYRVLTAMPSNGTPSVGPAPFSIDVVTLGTDPKTTEVALPALRDLGTGAGEYHYASDFLDAVAAGPDNAAGSEYGFTIYAGTMGHISCGGPGGPLPPPVKTQVVIDKITIE
jgi:hypothetical protein